MFEVLLISKHTNKRVETIASNVSEAEALNICEEWGWSYSDEKGCSYWLDYEEV